VIFLLAAPSTRSFLSPPKLENCKLEGKSNIRLLRPTADGAPSGKHTTTPHYVEHRHMACKSHVEVSNSAVAFLLRMRVFCVGLGDGELVAPES